MRQASAVLVDLGPSDEFEAGLSGAFGGGEREGGWALPGRAAAPLIRLRGNGRCRSWVVCCGALTAGRD